MKLEIEVLKSLIQNSSLDYRKKNIIGVCPYCGGDEFGVSISENHRFGCFRKKQCGATGNIFTLLKKLDRLDLLRNKGVITLSSYTFVENLIDQKLPVLDPLPEIKPPVGWRRVMIHPYLVQRGFSEQDFQYYEIGITKLDSKLRDRVVFLIRQNNRIVATVARTIKSKEEIQIIEKTTGERYPRYRNSSTDFEQLLLGIDECTDKTDTVILVEGIMGKRNVDEKMELRKIDEVKCLCTFGAKLSETQLMLLHLAGITNIVLLYDPDVIGYIKKYSARLVDEFESVKIGIIQDVTKDPADLTTEEMNDVLDKLRGVMDFQINTVEILKLR
jgi:DNA primase